MQKIEFRCIVDCPEVTDVVAQWLWGFWGAPGNKDFYHSFVAHGKKEDFPAIFVAFVDDRPVGTVALLCADLFSRQDLYPWMADLYVLPEYRSQGIGSALQDFILEVAKRRGYPAIYLYTPLVGYYEKKGWEYVDDEMDRDCSIVRIYKKKL